MGHSDGPDLGLRGGNLSADNVPKLLREFPATRAGYFGRPGSSTRVRVIESQSPAETAWRFVQLAATQAVRIEQIGDGKGTLRVMRDGTVITHRYTSASDGTPAVTLTIKGLPGLRSQKIHFTRRKK